MGKNNLNKILHHIAGLKTDKSTSQTVGFFAKFYIVLMRALIQKRLKNRGQKKSLEGNSPYCRISSKWKVEWLIFSIVPKEIPHIVGFLKKCTESSAESGEFPRFPKFPRLLWNFAKVPQIPVFVYPNNYTRHYFSKDWPILK